MLRALPFIIELILLIFCLFDLAMSPEGDIRNLPKWAWLLIIILLPIVGPIAWLIAGRPQSVQAPSRREFSQYPSAAGPLAPDDDPEFLRRLEEQRQKAERDRLREWQSDLERREREMNDKPDTDKEN